MASTSSSEDKMAPVYIEATLDVPTFYLRLCILGYHLFVAAFPWTSLPEVDLEISRSTVRPLNRPRAWPMGIQGAKPPESPEISQFLNLEIGLGSYNFFSVLQWNTRKTIICLLSPKLLSKRILKPGNQVNPFPKSTPDYQYGDENFRKIVVVYTLWLWSVTSKWPNRLLYGQWWLYGQP